MSPKISIIIPVYNVEKYLAECLDSCINQTLHDIEIICINDCSPDNSQKILDEYKNKDIRVKIIKHEKNLGLGGARNTGIENASGEYLWFVDSDDFISENACQLLYDTAKEHNLDMLNFNLISFYDNQDGTKRYVEDVYDTDWGKHVVFQPLKDFDVTKGNWPPVSACSYIIKTVFVKQFRFRLHCYYEDTDWTMILYASAQRVRCMTYTAYHRRITPGSITQSEMTERKFCDKIEVARAFRKFVEKIRPNHKSFIYQFYFGYYAGLAKDARKSSYPNNKIEDFIKESKHLLRLYELHRLSKNMLFLLLHPLKYMHKLFGKKRHV